MSRPRFLADNDLKDQIVLGVLRREPTLEFPRLRDLGLERLPDSEVLEYAARGQLILLSALLVDIFREFPRRGKSTIVSRG